jgi:hypothetical protein
MRICTSPHDGATGASPSLTPSAVTAFLLDLWTRPSTTVADVRGFRRLPKLQASDSGEALTDQLVDWLRSGLWGFKYADIVEALGAYTACDTRFGHA